MSYDDRPVWDDFDKFHTQPSPPAPRAEPSVGIEIAKLVNALEDAVRIALTSEDHSSVEYDDCTLCQAEVRARAALLDHERRLRGRVAELEADALTPDEATVAMWKLGESSELIVAFAKRSNLAEVATLRASAITKLRARAARSAPVANHE